MPSEEIEDAIRSARVTTDAAGDERIIAAAEAAMAKRNQQQPAPIGTSGPIRRAIMKNTWTKLATAAAVIVAVMLAMYAMTGSVDGTSITLAQVKQAMEKVDWMQIILTSKIKEGEQIDWYSFASKVHISVHPVKGIDYSDFKAGRSLFWPGKGDYIYESPMDGTREFADGAPGPFEMIDMSLSLAQAEQDANVDRKPGTYQGQRVEVWTAAHVKRDSPRKLVVYMDIDRKLPIAATYRCTGTDTIHAEDNHIEFKYPATGPTDIYQAGAPASAQIKASKEP